MGDTRVELKLFIRPTQVVWTNYVELRFVAQGTLGYKHYDYMDVGLEAIYNSAMVKRIYWDVLA